MSIILDDTPMALFYEKFTRISAQNKVLLSTLAEHYVVNLLSSVHSRRLITVKEFLTKAQKLSGPKRIVFLRRAGDSSLMIAGFWSDFVYGRKSFVSPGYYIAEGRSAYASIGPEHHRGVFTELAAKFAPVFGVINQISEELSLTNMKDILRIYERWQNTRNPRLAKILASKGINVVSGKTGRA